MMRLENGYVVSAVPTQMADEAWPAVCFWIEEAVKYGIGYQPLDVLAKLKSGMALLWIVEHNFEIVGACVTEVITYPRCNSLWIWLLGGADFKQWKDCIAELEMYARHNKCDYIEASGRPGLSRVLKDLGFEIPRIQCAKRVDPITH